MTCREKLKIEHPEKVNDNCYGGCYGCPYDYGYLTRPEYCNCGSAESVCIKCWDREIPGTAKENGDSRLIDELTKENEDLRIKLRETQTKLEEKEYLQKYESNDEHCNNISAKLSEAHRKQIEAKAKDYRMKFDALINQGFTEDQAMQFLPMWMDD
jgi:hypothetical protein